ncbi:MAG: hypothetical protein JWP34_4645 [Massilia sp.]|nr:hypothetical protein [Massilia sp.]
MWCIWQHFTHGDFRLKYCSTPSPARSSSAPSADRCPCSRSSPRGDERNDLAEPSNFDLDCSEVQGSITALKCKSHEWHLLNKLPSKIGHYRAVAWALPNPVTKEGKAVSKLCGWGVQKRGLPQPLTPYDDIGSTNWYIPFAIWKGPSLYPGRAVSDEDCCTYQCNLGRFLYAWLQSLLQLYP